MGKHETTRRIRWSAAARIVLALAALTPAAHTGPDRAPEQLAPASAAHVIVVETRESKREAAEWERVRRHLAHL